MYVVNASILKSKHYLSTTLKLETTNLNLLVIKIIKSSNKLKLGLWTMIFSIISFIENKCLKDLRDIN